MAGLAQRAAIAFVGITILGIPACGRAASPAPLTTGTLEIAIVDDSPAAHLAATDFAMIRGEAVPLSTRHTFAYDDLHSALGGKNGEPVVALRIVGSDRQRFANVMSSAEDKDIVINVVGTPLARVRVMKPAPRGPEVVLERQPGLGDALYDELLKRAAGR